MASASGAARGLTTTREFESQLPSASSCPKLAAYMWYDPSSACTASPPQVLVKLSAYPRAPAARVWLRQSPPAPQAYAGPNLICSQCSPAQPRAQRHVPRPGGANWQCPPPLQSASFPQPGPGAGGGAGGCGGAGPGGGRAEAPATQSPHSDGPSAARLSQQIDGFTQRKALQPACAVHRLQQLAGEEADRFGMMSSPFMRTPG